MVPGGGRALRAGGLEAAEACTVTVDVCCCFSTTSILSGCVGNKFVAGWGTTTVGVAEATAAATTGTAGAEAAADGGATVVTTCVVVVVFIFEACSKVFNLSSSLCRNLCSFNNWRLNSATVEAALSSFEEVFNKSDVFSKLTVVVVVLVRFFFKRGLVVSSAPVEDIADVEFPAGEVKPC